MTRLCRMPSCGSACMMRTRRRTASAVIRLSASSTMREVVLRAPALAEVADVAGLEAGVLRAAAIGDRNDARASRWPVRRSRLLGRGDGGIVGVAQHVERETDRRRRRAARPSSSGDRWRMIRSGGSLRMQTRMAVEAVIGSSPRTRAAAGVTEATGSRAKRMMRRPMVAFQKPITNHGSVTANRTTRTRSTASKPPAESATAQQPDQARRSKHPTSVKNSTRRRVGRPVGAASTASSRRDWSTMNEALRVFCGA